MHVAMVARPAHVLGGSWVVISEVTSQRSMGYS